MKKSIISIVLVLIIVVLAMSSCSGSAPKIDEVRDRIVYLIEGSKEINILFFGSGLPTYKRDGLIETELGVYYDDEYTAYNKVMENSRFKSIDDMKKAAERVYSENYLDAIYETAFEGYMTGSSSAYMRFYETSDWMYQSISATDFDLSERIYDYSSMEIVKPSNGEYLNITIDTYTLRDKKVKTITLSFIYERGNWYLDSPTY
ncbi:MAG: hypothetical protein ACI3X1_08010 [Eubacteriales bacterium]